MKFEINEPICEIHSGRKGKIYGNYELLDEDACVRYVVLYDDDKEDCKQQWYDDEDNYDHNMNPPYDDEYCYTTTVYEDNLISGLEPNEWVLWKLEH